ncbi:MAG: multiheme c-type cytochrome [Armatimonadota bacterium]
MSGRKALLGVGIAALAIGATWLHTSGRPASAQQGSQCIACHSEKQIAMSAVRDFQRSAHAKIGLDCVICHIPAENAPASIKSASTTCEDKRVRKSVGSANCAVCHSQQVTQFHAGKHSKAWVALEAMPETKSQPDVVVAGLKGCGGCHRIGLDEGKCDSCHTRHVFSAAEARRMEACQTCHMGFDHPQAEMYGTSKHGSIMTIERDRWDWDMKLASWPHGKPADGKLAPRTPTCAFCHMPNGDHGVRTAWGFLALRLPEDDPEWMKDRATLLQALGVLDDKGQPTGRLDVVVAGDVARLTAEDWQKERKRMLDQCVQCHSRSYAEAELAKGDQVIREADRLVAEAVRIVHGLYADGIIQRPKDVPPHTDLLRFYDLPTPIEQRLYVMFLSHRMRAFQGAFHMNPDYQHWYGWAELKRDLVEIRAMAQEMREAHRRRTNL